MPDAVAGKVRAKSRPYWWRFRPDARSRRERGPHIDRHPMGRCRCFLSQIVDGHTDYDTRRCGGPIGAIRGSQRLSSVIFHGFWPFSLRDAAQSLPRLLPRVDRLLWPFFVGGFVARGCPRVELRAKNPKKTECGCCSGLSNLLARPVGKLSDTENDVWSTQRSPLYKICRSDEGCAGWAAMGLPFRLLGKVN